MSVNTGKGIKVQKFYDKENIQPNFNSINNPQLPNKQSIKTGIEIKNKLKAKNVLKSTSVSGKKQQIRKNSHIMQKVHRKIFQSKNSTNDRKQPGDECNLSSSSSVRSIKSVTFSIDRSIEGDKSLSHSSFSTGLRKKSILKNKLNKDTIIKLCQKQSLASSYCSYLKSIDQAVQNPNSNNIVLQKYERLLKQLKSNSQKYTDTIYPPCQQSIFLKSSYTKDFLQKLNNQGYRIKWIRMTELFPDKQTCLWHPQVKSIVTKGFIHSSGKQNNYIPTVLNSINKSYMMQKFFQNQTISQEGIYFVKMHQTQTNHWKYVIVDDFIPVIVSNKKHEMGKIIKPAFLNVESENKIVQLWPFLVQKAFAKYYATYDSLIKGNTLDFLQEVTGDYFTTISLNFQQKESGTDSRKKLDKLMKNPYNVILAQTTDGLIYPLRSISAQIQLLDIENNYRLQKIDRTNFESYFSKLHIIEAKKYSNQINCPIKQQHLLQKQKELHENKKPFILRTFTLQQSTSCILALTQKEQRCYRNNKTSKIKQNYTYSWMRVILVFKEPTGYRWIKAAYERKKTIKIQVDLQPGEYFVIILPEWSIKPYDLKLTVFSNSETVIERKPYESHMRIIEQSCMDLAQRYGKLTQINNNICSYNYIDYMVGFIIENINNEKSSGEVKILRTIDGLDTYNITPVNVEFEQSQKLEIKIPSMQSYTVVLKVSGGVDKSFLEQFDFGI